MIKLIVLLTVLCGSTGRDSTGNGTSGVPVYLQEYFREARDSVREPDVNDIFMIVTPAEKGKGVYRDMWYDTTQFTTPLINYHLKMGGVYFMLSHSNADRKKIRSSYRGKGEEPPAPPKQVVRTLPRTFLSKVKVMDLNKQFDEMKGNEEKMRQFREEFGKSREKRLWVIDRTFMTGNSIRLVEVGFAIVIL